MTKVLGVFVNNASRKPVLNSMKIIKHRYLPKNKLIADSNQLKRGAIAAIDKHRKNLKPNDVGIYIAASSLSHLMDGWGYLSHAVNAFLNGNNGVAIHLAYYAELRAVMSLLATEGIGVFNSKHLNLKEPNSFDLFLKRKRRFESGNGKPLGTHVFAWNAFEKWCGSIKPSYHLLRMFKVKGHSFSDLLPGFHPNATELVSSSIAKIWVKKWAFDIKKYTNDRDLRNFVSYRPQTMSGFENQHDFKAAISNIYRLLQVLSPTFNNPFDYLDKLLLKALFDELYAHPEIARRGTLFDLIDEAFMTVGATFDSTTQRILLSDTCINDSHLIFSEASKLEVKPLPVISRASLLLRVSTGSVSVLLQDATITKEELAFIWNSYGFNNGFWATPKPVSAFFELWSEIESEYSDIANSLDSIENNSFSVRGQLSEDLNLLSQFNRAALWGID